MVDFTGRADHCGGIMTESDTQRLDKWLWAARFYKTRSLASDAIDGGKVRVNGARVKASRNIKPGDCITVTRDQLIMDVVVCALNMQRRPATEAQLLYEEKAESIKRREQKMEASKFLDSAMSQPSRRPGKKDRRQIAKFIGTN